MTGITIFIAIVILWFYLRHLGRKHNRVDWGTDWVNTLDGLMRLYCYKFHHLKHDPFNLPESGGAVVVSNHSTGVDPFLLLSSCDRPLRFMIATEEYNRPLLNRLFKAVGCIPVDRQGRPEKAYREAIKKIKEGEAIALFPHGSFHLDDAEYKPIKKGGLRLAQLSKSPIIPCRISGMRALDTVFISLFVRGNARLQVFPEIPAESIDNETSKVIEKLILGKQ